MLPPYHTEYFFHGIIPFVKKQPFLFHLVSGYCRYIPFVLQCKKQIRECRPRNTRKEGAVHAYRIVTEMEETLWNGYVKQSFEWNGHSGLVVLPKTPCARHRWVWRAEFFGAFDYADRALLEQGWHIAYYSVSNMYGNPESIQLMKAFHDFVVPKFQLNPRADLFGFSRGGLYAVNYAAAYPEDVATLYLDAPVLDITSWPGMLHRTRQYRSGAARKWEECKQCYHLENDEQALAFRQNPLDKIDALLAAKLPVIVVAGDSDIVVDFTENGKLFAQRYQAGGGTIKLIVKPGCGHHPHSLEDPAEIVAFIAGQQMAD